MEPDTSLEPGTLVVLWCACHYTLSVFLYTYLLVFFSGKLRCKLEVAGRAGAGGEGQTGVQFGGGRVQGNTSSGR